MALTIVSTVSLGLGLVAVAFTLLNMALFRVDPSVPRLHEMFSVEMPRAADGGLVRFTRADYDALREQTSVFTGVYAERPEIDTRIEGRMMSGSLVSGNFFQVLGVDPVLGRALTPADDERFAGRPVIVLSHRGWNRSFARDPNVLGRSVLINGFPYEIVGVMPEEFRGLSVTAAYLLGAAGDARSVPADSRWPRAGYRRRRHHRPPQAGPVARDGAGRACRLEFRPGNRRNRSRAVADPAPAETTARCRSPSKCGP